MVYYNATSAVGMTAVASLSWPAVAVLALIMTCGIIFLLCKYFRYFMYGLAAMIPLAIIGFITTKITSEAAKGNNWPFYILGITFFTILLSTYVGKVLSQFKWFKKIENKLR